MDDTQQRKAAREFAEYWKDRGFEKGESQPFWLSLLQDVYGVQHPEQFISFEDQVHLDHTSFIDGYINKTHVMIEQKGRKKSLTAAIRQSDGSMLTPFQQAKRYSSELPYSQRPRWIVTCNFQQFFIYDMEKPGGDPAVVLLENLEKEYYRLQFLVDVGNENLQRETEVSVAAGEIVGLLYDALAKQYKDPTTSRAMKSLNVLCVRLVFCLYAEDAGIFGRRGLFHDYLEDFDTQGMRKALVELFKVLDQKKEERDPYLVDDNPKLDAFPYVNGGLFSDENIEIPPFTDEIRTLLLEDASANFDWSEISPTIFGAVFESTLNPETRRSGGMHYTSIENIHKVIDPLFLDELKKELEVAKNRPIAGGAHTKALQAFQKKIASLKFLDPACGSGNFLTESYISLRHLENIAIQELDREKKDGQISLMFGEDDNLNIQVSIQQFYGIEINDFAVTVAKTALWIAESQMLEETKRIVNGFKGSFLPLKTYVNIAEGNALRMDWNDVVPARELSYIMGNPPFVGATICNAGQKKEIVDIVGKIKLSNSLDYVVGWYYKAAEMIKNTAIRVAFVSTNSVTQGEQVFPMWNRLLNEYEIHIDFAYKTFVWDSEASDKAHVHCVIIGFSNSFVGDKFLYDNGMCRRCGNISPYLIDAPDILIQSRSKPISKVPCMVLGNKPADGGNLILSPQEKKDILKKEPNLRQYIRKYMGSVEFINSKERYCLWLKDVSPSVIRKSAILRKRVEAVREMRLNSSAAPTREKADTPQLFFFVSQPETNYLLVPSTSSQNRRYVPIGFLASDIIASNAATIVPNATLYHFGVLTSNMHMAWLRTVGGRLKSDYRYSNSVVYNTFPWPEASEEQIYQIECTADSILKARANHPECTLADMYDSIVMPNDLRRAHQLNDKAVMKAYGFNTKMTESECVAELMKRYQQLTE